MALHTLGTTTTTALTALQWWPAVVATSNYAAKQLGLGDLQNFNDSILSTSLSGALLNQTGPSGILFTTTTAGTVTLGTLASVSGPPLSAIQVGASIVGVGIPAGTYVQAKTPATGTPTSLTLSQAATTSLATQHMIAVNPTMLTFGNAKDGGLDPATGRVWLPDNRGYIQLNPGDYVAVDNTGSVIVIPLNTVGYAQSLWSFV